MNRTLLVCYAFVMAVMPIAPRASMAHAAPPRVVTSFPSEPSQPNGKRILLIGDSNFFGPLGHVLARELVQRGYRVSLVAKSASGLSHPQFFNWFQTAPRLIASWQPDIVIALFGGNDAQPITALDHGEPERVSYRDVARWDAAYETRVRELAAILRGASRQVFLLSPTNRPEPARARVIRIKGLQQAAVQDVVNVHAIDMFPFSTDPRGAYLQLGLDDGGHLVHYRRPDGVHLTPAGAEIVGMRLMGHLISRFGL